MVEMQGKSTWRRLSSLGCTSLLVFRHALGATTRNADVIIFCSSPGAQRNVTISEVGVALSCPVALFALHSRAGRYQFSHTYTLSLLVCQSLFLIKSVLFCMTL